MHFRILVTKVQMIELKHPQAQGALLSVITLELSCFSCLHSAGPLPCLMAGPVAYLVVPCAFYNNFKLVSYIGGDEIVFKMKEDEGVGEELLCSLWKAHRRKGRAFCLCLSHCSCLYLRGHSPGISFWPMQSSRGPYAVLTQSLWCSESGSLLKCRPFLFDSF